LYYAVPYVEGESLRDRLNREKQLPIADAIQITKEVADALSYAHSHGVVHRDIKPENILFTAGHALVSFLQIALAVTEAGDGGLTDDAIAVGTPEYMSPEQASGDKDIDARSDIYSLGCVLYEMLAGDPPYTATTTQALLAKKQSEPTPRISVVRETVPADVEATLFKALEKNPADRFATAQQFAGALETPKEGFMPEERIAGHGKRSAWQWVVGVAALFAIMAAGVVLSMSRRSGANTAGVEEVDRLVVAPLENRTGDSAAADWGFLAAEYVTRALDRASIMTVVPASAVRDLVREVDLAEGMPLAEIAQRIGARYAVVGSYALSGNRLRFDVQLVNAESGGLEWALDPITGQVDSLVEVFTALAERVTATAAARLSPDLEAGFGSRVYSAPPTQDAVRGLLAMQDLFCARRYPEAIDLAQSVLEETPDFAPLLVLSSIALGNRGRTREADSVLELIEPLGRQLTSAERSLAQWYHGRLHGDYDEMTRAVGQLFRIRPDGYGYHAGITALQTNRFADALEYLLATDLESPCYRTWSSWWIAAGDAYYMLGRYQEGLEVVRDGLDRFPGVRGLIYREAITLAGLGRLEAVDSIVDMVTELPPQRRARDTWTPGNEMALIALELVALGFHEASERLMERALNWFAEWPPDELRFERAQVLYYGERWADADTLFAALIEEEPENLNLRGHYGVTLAHLNRREEALQAERWLAELDRPYMQGAHTRWRAAIAAALGEREDAVLLLRQAHDEGMQLGHLFRRDPEWRPLYGYRLYEEFVRAR
jgi:tetratricopeptide (TPR) repeat protein